KVHRTGGYRAVIVDTAKHLAQGGLCKFDGHTKHASCSNPERSAGPTHGDGDGNTSDIAKANRAGELCGKGLETGHLPGVGFLGQHSAHGANGLFGVFDRPDAQIDVTKYATGNKPHDYERKVSAENRNGKEHGRL